MAQSCRACAQHAFGGAPCFDSHRRLHHRCFWPADETPQHHLKLITKCTKQLDGMVSFRFCAIAMRINHEQCQYLVYKLRIAVQNHNHSRHQFLLTWRVI